MSSEISGPSLASQLNNIPLDWASWLTLDDGRTVAQYINCTSYNEVVVDIPIYKPRKIRPRSTGSSKSGSTSCSSVSRRPLSTGSSSRSTSCSTITTMTSSELLETDESDKSVEIGVNESRTKGCKNNVSRTRSKTLWVRSRSNLGLGSKGNIAPKTTALLQAIGYDVPMQKPKLLLSKDQSRRLSSQNDHIGIDNSPTGDVHRRRSRLGSLFRSRRQSG